MDTPRSPTSALYQRVDDYDPNMKGTLANIDSCTSS